MNGTNVPTGAVALYQNATFLQSGNLTNGQVTLNVTLGTGNQTVLVVYSGDVNNVSSSTSFSEYVLSPTSTFLSSSVNPGSSAQPITLTASVSSEGATGTITFFDGATPLGGVSVNYGFVPPFSVRLSAGTHSLTAVYSGDGNYAGSTSSVFPETVLPGAAVTVRPATLPYFSVPR